MSGVLTSKVVQQSGVSPVLPPQRIANKHSDKPLTILAVNVAEEEHKVREFVKNRQLELPVVLDPRNEIVNSYGVKAVPHIALIGKTGRLEKILFGAPMDSIEMEIVDVLSQE